MEDYLEKFKNWFRLKILLWEKDNKHIFFKQNDVWWCSVGMNLGEEIFGKGNKFTRPVFIFKKFTSNSFLGIPFTSKEKVGSWYVKITLQNKNSWAILNQIRLLDKKRLTYKIGELDGKDVIEISRRLTSLLFEKDLKK